MANSGAEATFQRVARVDEVIKTRGWDLKIADELAAELSVDRATVYRYRMLAERWTRKHTAALDVERWRARQVQATWEGYVEARSKGDYTGAAKFLELQARMVGTIAPMKVEARVTGIVGHVPLATDHAALLTELQDLASRRQVVDTTAEVVPRDDGEER